VSWKSNDGVKYFLPYTRPRPHYFCSVTLDCPTLISFGVEPDMTLSKRSNRGLCSKLISLVEARARLSNTTYLARPRPARFGGNDRKDSAPEGRKHAARP